MGDKFVELSAKSLKHCQTKGLGRGFEKCQHIQRQSAEVCRFRSFPNLLIRICFNPHLQVAPPIRSRACFVS